MRYNPYFNHRLNHEHPLPERMFYGNTDTDDKLADGRLATAIDGYTKVLELDIPELSPDIDDAVELELIHARRERAWALFLALHQGRADVYNRAGLDHTEEMKMALESSAAMLRIDEKTSPVNIFSRLQETHDKKTHEDTKEIITVHADSLFMWGRMLALQAVAYCGEPLLRPGLEKFYPVHLQLDEPKQKFEEAYSYAMLGIDPVLVTDIATHGARIEVANGSSPKGLSVARWLLRRKNGIRGVRGFKDSGLKSDAKDETRRIIETAKPAMKYPTAARKSIDQNP